MDDNDDDLMVYCPKCKTGEPDLDGFGFLSCNACGHCLHPSGFNGRCLICGVEMPGPPSKLKCQAAPAR